MLRIYECALACSLFQEVLQYADVFPAVHFVKYNYPVSGAEVFDLILNVVIFQYILSQRDIHTILSKFHQLNRFVSSVLIRKLFGNYYFERSEH